MEKRTPTMDNAAQDASRQVGTSLREIARSIPVGADLRVSPNSDQQKTHRPRVLIVGAGFGGLRVALGLNGTDVDVTVVDHHNYHTFIPLLYQVATSGLEPGEIAQPVRAILHGKKNAEFRMAQVTEIGLDRCIVYTSTGEMEYDYLVLAAGSVTNYFGLNTEANAVQSLRELDDAEALRNHILRTFEKAAIEEDPERQRELMTMVVVGGGPTGVELSGALVELKRHVLSKDYPNLGVSSAQVVLIEAGDRLLAMMPKELSEKALKTLKSMGVQVRLNSMVQDVTPSGLLLKTGEALNAGTVVWVAGVQASPLVRKLEKPTGPGGRVIVNKSLQLPGHPEVYIAGDMAYVPDTEGGPYPMLAAVAVQQGDMVAKNIRRQLKGEEPVAFTYKDRGSMATIGRNAAVADVFGMKLDGFIAWFMWLTIHLIWLIGLRNKLLVLVNWVWNYFTHDRGVRLIRDHWQ